jgi:hypothetical protein
MFDEICDSITPGYIWQFLLIMLLCCIHYSNVGLALRKPATFVSWYGSPAPKLMGLRQPKWPEVLIFQPPVDLDQRDHVAETLTAVIFASKVAGAAKQMSPISVAVSIGEKPSITFCQGRRQALAQPLVTRDQ